MIRLIFLKEIALRNSEIFENRAFGAGLRDQLISIAPITSADSWRDANSGSDY
ncbi:MAG TPA: hypothetical protein PK429_01040 [Candidatus Pacearchaeota archaeon]|nr:hypothetical protein [Candidatus Pacearchaeota archaeon]